MKTVFREFNNIKFEMEKLDKHTIIVFDTNTLLNIYRYSKETRDIFLDSLNRVKANIWIPYQVGLEFNLRRREIMSEVEKKRDSIADNLKQRAQKSIIDVVKRELDLFPIKSTDGIELRKNIVKDFSIKIGEQIEEFSSNELEKLINLIDVGEDQLSRLTEIFIGRVGESFTQDEITVVCNDGVSRYEKEIPPGYKDAGKKELTNYNGLEFESKYGDLILWKQIIKKAKDDKMKTVIFVTDDEKDDWWYKINGEKIGARAELRNEMLRFANADLLIISTNKFLKETSMEKLEKDLVNTDATTESSNLGGGEIDSSDSYKMYMNNVTGNKEQDLEFEKKLLINKVEKLILEINNFFDRIIDFNEMQTKGYELSELLINIKIFNEKLSEMFIDEISKLHYYKARYLGYELKFNKIKNGVYN